jgi:hypothetical protein
MERYLDNQAGQAVLLHDNFSTMSALISPCTEEAVPKLVSGRMAWQDGGPAWVSMRSVDGTAWTAGRERATLPGRLLS